MLFHIFISPKLVNVKAKQRYHLTQTLCEQIKLAFVTFKHFGRGYLQSIITSSDWRLHVSIDVLTRAVHVTSQTQGLVTCSNSFTSSSFLCSRLAFAVFSFSTSSISYEAKQNNQNKTENKHWKNSSEFNSSQAR